MNTQHPNAVIVPFPFHPHLYPLTTLVIFSSFKVKFTHPHNSDKWTHLGSARHHYSECFHLSSSVLLRPRSSTHDSLPCAKARWAARLAGTQAGPQFHRCLLDPSAVLLPLCHTAIKSNHILAFSTKENSH